ncbi:MAG TPA: hypothetical protein VMX36_15410 [Sedimentisphaerales bacterium]|nr:hypothetical protein [Sedimentisphaerales bacterium]
MWFWAAKKQSQFKANSKPILFSPQIFWGLKTNLKKQSQFAKRQNDVKSILTMVYGDFSRMGQRKNKANQSQFKANFLLRRAGQTHLNFKGFQMQHAETGKN